MYMRRVEEYMVLHGACNTLHAKLDSIARLEGVTQVSRHNF